MNYNSLMNKPTINYRELIGDNTVTEVGGITEEQFNTLLNTDLSSYYTKAQIDDLFSRSFVYREKSGSIVTFDCPESTTGGITKVVSDIVAVQSGTGDPSPTNIRPITGWSAVNVYISPTTLSSDGTTYTTTLKDGQGNPMTCYGGALSNENGVQTLNNGTGIVDLGTLNWIKGNMNTAGTGRIFYVPLTASSPMKQPSDNGLCEALKYNPFSSWPAGQWEKQILNAITVTASSVLVACAQDIYATASDFKTAMSGVMLVYELKTPQQIPQDSLSIATQDGTNNIWTDSGDITVKALDRIIQG